MSSSKFKKRYSKSSTSWPKEKFRDYSSDCEYCCRDSYLDLSIYPDKNNNLKKHKKTQPNNIGISKDCIGIKRLEKNHPKYNSLDENQWSTRINNNDLNIDGDTKLCESMRNLCLSPDVFKAYKTIPEHDKKIINRMAKKRTEKSQLTTNAWLAQKYWENERYERELLKCEQEEITRNRLREKQENDFHLTKIRMETLSKRDRKHFEKLQQLLSIKDLKLEHRLKNLQLQQELSWCERNQERLRKIEQLSQIQDELTLDDELRKYDIYERLENRLTRAESIRNHFLDVYRRRIKHDNRMEHILHEENFNETKKFESYKIEQLKRQIKQKEKKMQKFIEVRRRSFDRTVEKARLSASLRDLVRRSISPDNFQFNVGKMVLERPLSNLSFQSCIKLG